MNGHVLQLCYEVDSPTQPCDFPLQEGAVPTGVQVDDSLIADVLCSTGELQRAERLLCTHLAGADVGYDHSLGIAT